MKSVLTYHTINLWCDFCLFSLSLLPPATKLGQGYVLDVCVILFMGGRVYPSMHCRWYLSMPCSRSPGDAIPACLAAGLQGGLLLGDLLGGSLLLGGGAWWRTSPRDGYCCGQYASYWNAFLFYLSFSMITSKSTRTRLISLLISYEHIFWEFSALLWPSFYWSLWAQRNVNVMILKDKKSEIVLRYPPRTKKQQFIYHFQRCGTKCNTHACNFQLTWPKDCAADCCPGHNPVKLITL